MSKRQQITIDAAEFQRRRHAAPMPTKDAEFRCDTCHARCTETAAGTECGHKYECPHRPDGLPAGGAGGGAYHGGDEV